MAKSSDTYYYSHTQLALVTLSSGLAEAYMPGTSGRYRQSGGPDEQGKRPPVSAETGGKDVLVVEDEAYLCDLIADVLEADGHRVLKAGNGLEALQQLRVHRPQIILLDLMMPVMDGWEFMSTLKREPEWASIPVVIITAIYDVKRTLQETGARAVITKPFDIDQISEIVRAYAS